MAEQLSSTKAADTIAATDQAPEFAIQRLYVKDMSFESPQSPQLFTQEWQPNIQLELQTQSRPLNNALHEVVLKLTVTAKKEETTGFLVEVQQAGLFLLKGFTDEQQKQLLASFCPNILYPYAREAISNLSTRGGFPPLYLAPINFDQLYTEQQAQAQKAAGTDTTKEKEKEKGKEASKLWSKDSEEEDDKKRRH